MYIHAHTPVGVPASSLRRLQGRSARDFVRVDGAVPAVCNIVYIYLSIYLSLSLSLSIYIYTYTCMYVCMHACMYVCMYVCKCRHSIVVRRLDRGAKVPGSIPAVINYTG